MTGLLQDEFSEDYVKQCVAYYLATRNVDDIPADKFDSEAYSVGYFNYKGDQECSATN